MGLWCVSILYFLVAGAWINWGRLSVLVQRSSRSRVPLMIDKERCVCRFILELPCSPRAEGVSYRSSQPWAVWRRRWRCRGLLTWWWRWSLPYRLWLGPHDTLSYWLTSTQPSAGSCDHRWRDLREREIYRHAYSNRTSKNTETHWEKRHDTMTQTAV